MSGIEGLLEKGVDLIEIERCNFKEIIERIFVRGWKLGR